jgi:predicted transcriptional regulator
MPRKKTTGLTDAELRLMEVLWRAGPSTVQNVVDALETSGPLAYSSVLTTLRILEQKGYLRHRKEGRAFMYEAVVGRDQARENAVTHLLRRFFENSPEQLVLNLIDGKRIGAKQLQRLRKRIEEAGE